MIPLGHDFEGETVLVFGAGAVGARKARRFAREARVIVLGPTVPGEEAAATDTDWEWIGSDSGRDGDVEFVRAAPEPEAVADWLDRTEPALVIAATDDGEVNDAIESAARERHVLLNRADRAGGRDIGSVTVPATVRDGPVTVAISTGGTSPALARELRERTEAELEGAGAMAELTGELRERFKEAELPPEERRELLRTVVRSPQVWKGLRTGKQKGAQEAERVIRRERGPSP